MKKKLLLVDDEELFSVTLQAFLDAKGYLVDLCDTGEAGFEALRRTQYDLLILDLTLPDEDGLCMLRKIRNQHELPVIIISGRASDEDRVAGLELGADDYMVKPFSPKELVLRIEKRLDLSKAPVERRKSADKIRFGPWLLDKNAWEVVHDSGEVVELTPRELEVLAALASHIGHVLSRDQLLDSSLNINLPESNRAIDVIVSRLRSKLEADPNAPSLIKTVKGVGYKLAPH